MLDCPEEILACSDWAGRAAFKHTAVWSLQSDRLRGFSTPEGTILVPPDRDSDYGSWNKKGATYPKDPSQAVCERPGLKNEGVLREAEWLYDHYVALTMSAVLKSEWRK
jgi:hypothetical protein